MKPSGSPVVGLKENWKQFSLLVLINAFVGGMVGLERSIFPEYAGEFGLKTTSALLSFIVAFGLSKALANYFTGKLANRYGRKALLVAGWILALPVPVLLLVASNWNVVVIANILLGISQGLTWSSTVVMKIDLAGPKNRGLAMGINESAGYLSVGLVAFLSGYLAANYGLRPLPFYLGIAIAVTGLFLSFFWVKDTRCFIAMEQPENEAATGLAIFTSTTFTHKTLSSVTQAGLINNLNDGMVWGLLPIFLKEANYNLETIGLIAATYPAVWGIGQLFTGRLADLYSKKHLLVLGMLLQGVVLCALPESVFNLYHLLFLASILGLGTALVYPTFLATIADVTSPISRAESVGVFRLWRDMGYVVGALASGILADWLGLEWAIYSIGLLTLISGGIIVLRMPATTTEVL